MIAKVIILSLLCSGLGHNALHQTKHTNLHLNDTYKDISTTMYDVLEAKQSVGGVKKNTARLRQPPVSLEKITLGVKVGWCALSMGVMLFIEVLLSSIYS